MSNLQQRAQETLSYVSATVDPYVPTAAKNAASMLSGSASKAFAYSSQQAQSAMEYGKVVVSGATTTLTAYTPGPILSLVNSTLAQARELREDPVNTVKTYVPTFVIHAGEKTYEIVSHTGEKTYEMVSHTADSTKKNVEATSGFIVTKVNGVITSVANVPVIHSVVEKLQKLTSKDAPVAPAAEPVEKPVASADI
jgi:hypothetical protein